MLDMAIFHAPRAPRMAGRRAISSAARAHIAEAMRVLYGDAPGLQGDEALAERERYRCEDEAREAAQTLLPLDLAPSPRGDAEGIARAEGRSLNLDIAAFIQVPGEGSSLAGAVAGNSDPVLPVDSGTGSY